MMNFMLSILRVKIELQNPNDNAEFLVGPVGVLIDVPFDAGCFKVLATLTGLITEAADIMSPAWCVTKCLQSDDKKTFARRYKDIPFTLIKNHHIIFLQ